MRKPLFKCDRCGAEHFGNPYIVAFFQWDAVNQEMKSDKISAMMRSVTEMKFCKLCMYEIAECARGGANE